MITFQDDVDMWLCEFMCMCIDYVCDLCIILEIFCRWLREDQLIV